jgi:hypothetical protein
MSHHGVQTKPASRKSDVDLKKRIEHLEVELQKLLAQKPAVERLTVTLPELHDPKTGRIDVQKVADYMGVPFKRLAEGLHLTYKTVHRNSSAESVQDVLKPVKRSLEILHQFFDKPETIRVWLNTPHPDLDGRTALEVILTNNPEPVLTILENAVAGVPV